MTKLKAVYTQAEQTGRPVDEIALERFGDLRDFDDAREEQTELDRRHLYGEGYVGKVTWVRRSRVENSSKSAR
jgi:hypothetical protein